MFAGFNEIGRNLQRSSQARSVRKMSEKTQRARTWSQPKVPDPATRKGWPVVVHTTSLCECHDRIRDA